MPPLAQQLVADARADVQRLVDQVNAVPPVGSPPIPIEIEVAGRHATAAAAGA
jgi:hypothetical protein